jgi:hypothetical protein
MSEKTSKLEKARAVRPSDLIHPRLLKFKFARWLPSEERCFEGVDWRIVKELHST